MPNNSPTAEPRFFFLMPVWGKTYVDYLLTFGLPTLLAPNNLPWLPNRAVSQFTFITRVEDEKHIRASKLFARLEALIPVKFIFLDFYQSDRAEKFNQLGVALKLGAGEALGRGFCLFVHPDGLYSNGMLKFLYGVAKSGKKACVTHGPNASLEKIVPYLRERNLLTYDEVNPLASRVLARALMDNLHPDMTVHCMGNPHYPVDPYMDFWLSPKLDGALFRFVSLHPWIVDLSHLSEILDFTAIDHNFIRAHGFVWSDVHVETDSDNILVIGLKPENERNAIPNPGITFSPVTHLTRALRKGSNCNYSRFCFFHGLKVHTGDLDRDWYDFEVANLKWLNTVTDASMDSIILPTPVEPRFFFLMPVWGKTYVDYLLTFALPTLLAPNNLPWLPNRAVSQFTFITRVEDEKHIRASKLFAKLEALIPVKFIFLDFYQSDRIGKFTQLGDALKLGAEEALGKGYCLFFHPDGLYSDGMLKFLYGVARSGKKACVTHGPNASLEKIVPYLRERNQLTYDEVNPLSSRVLARALMDNLHPDTTIHCMGNPHYPVDPYMGFWLSPKLDGALFRFVSLHPWLADLSGLTEIVDFMTIDHNFIRAHGFIWSDVHVETDSDNILVIGLKPENERNAIPNPGPTLAPTDHLTRSLRKGSNCNYSRFCFFHGMRVHTGDLGEDWYNFEVANLRWLNKVNNARMTLVSLPFMSLQFHAEVYKYYRGLAIFTIKSLFRHLFVERRPLEALKYFLNVLHKLSDMILKPISRFLTKLYYMVDRRPNVSPPPITPESCAVCRSDARRCVDGDERSRV